MIICVENEEYNGLVRLGLVRFAVSFLIGNSAVTAEVLDTGNLTIHYIWCNIQLHYSSYIWSYLQNCCCKLSYEIFYNWTNVVNKVNSFLFFFEGFVMLVLVVLIRIKSGKKGIHFLLQTLLDFCTKH